MSYSTIKLIFIASVVSSVLAGCSNITTKEYTTYPDRIAPGILLEEPRAVLPQGVALRKVYPKGLKLTKVSEGWVDHLYNDAANFCTVAYGHLIKKARCNGTEPSEFKGTVPEPRGALILQKDMEIAEIVVQNSLKFDPNDGEFAALADFVFNVGSANFARSNLLKMVNARKYKEIPFEWRKWTKAGGRTFQGLVTRRENEIKLFFAESRAEISTEQPTADQAIDIRVGENPI